MIINKITYGYVVQAFDTEKNQFVSQAFYAGDQVEYETEIGDPIDSEELEEKYLPFDMVQPDNSKL